MNDRFLSARFLWIIFVWLGSLLALCGGCSYTRSVVSCQAEGVFLNDWAHWNRHKKMRLVLGHLYVGQTFAGHPMCPQHGGHGKTGWPNLSSLYTLMRPKSQGDRCEQERQSVATECWCQMEHMCECNWGERIGVHGYPFWMAQSAVTKNKRPNEVL